MANEKKYPQTEYNKRYQEKHDIVAKRFNFDRQTANLLEKLAKTRGESQTAVLKAALALLDKV